MVDVDGSPSQSPSAFPSSTSTSATSPPTSSSLTQFPVVKQLEKPNNDCEAIGPQYKISMMKGKVINALFNISCNTQFGQGDFMSFYSPSLTTCMQGSAMFNYWQSVYNNQLELNCSGVTYLPGTFEEGNCWLKPWGYTTATTQQENSSYARLNYVIWRWGEEALEVTTKGRSRPIVRAAQHACIRFWRSSEGFSAGWMPRGFAFTSLLKKL